MQCEELRAQLGKSEKAAAALQAERRKQADDLEFQDAEMQSLKQTVAQQSGELVRLHPHTLFPALPLRPWTCVRQHSELPMRLTGS